MVLKIINATEVRTGTSILIEGEPYTVRKMDVSKTGKHGHAKVRVEAIGIINENRKVFVVPGHERFEVPLIDKRKGQVLSVSESTASIMDLESFETLDVNCPEAVKSELEASSNVEYWDIEGQKIIKRKI
ncbi:MAG: translation initiation factor IF-5A [Candidatus Pacearchaeota archaeon]